MNKNFASKATPIVIMSFICMYLYAGLQTDHTNILQPYMSNVFGWSATKITNPMTFGAYFAIVFTFIVGTLMVKYNVKKVTAIGLWIMGIACVGLGISMSNGSYSLYAISLFFVRSFTVPLFMGSMMYCTNWFVRSRGRIMGIVTIGCPLESATLIAILTKVSNTAMGLRGAYIVIGIINIVIGIIIITATKDTPEEFGMNPDGADTPIELPEEGMITAKEVFSNKNAWLLMIGMGILQFIIIANMAFFVTDCTLAGTDTNVYLGCLTVGAILGIPISYLLGWVDDKIGTAKACMILTICFFLSCIGLIMVNGNSIGVLVLAVIGMAGMTGATPNLLPSLTAYIFGRKNYQAANRWTFAIISVFAAFATLYMALFLDHFGSLKMAYIIEIGMTVIALLCFMVINRTPDHDRNN